MLGYSKDRVLSPHHSSCKLLQKYMHSCLPCGWWVRNEQLWNRPKLTAIYLPSLVLKVSSNQWDGEFQNSYTRQILPIQLLFRWGEDSWCFLLYHFPRILSFLFLSTWFCFSTQYSINCAWFWTYINGTRGYIFWLLSFYMVYDINL